MAGNRVGSAFAVPTNGNIWTVSASSTLAGAKGQPPGRAARADPPRRPLWCKPVRPSAPLGHCAPWRESGSGSEGATQPSRRHRCGLICPSENAGRGWRIRPGPTNFAAIKQRRIGRIWGDRTRSPPAQILGRIGRGGASHGRGEEFDDGGRRYCEGRASCPAAARPDRDVIVPVDPAWAEAGHPAAALPRQAMAAVGDAVIDHVAAALVRRGSLVGLPPRLERAQTRSLGPSSIPPSATVLCSARRG